MPFANSRFNALTVVTNEKYSGTASLKVTVPPPGDPTEWFSGGAFTSNEYRDLSGYNAIVFWAKAGKSPAILNVAGLGNDNTGTSKYQAAWENIELTTEWRRYVIPIPLPAKLASERGLFFFAEGPEGSESYEFWLDEITFAAIGSVTSPRPVMETKTVDSFVGGTVDPGDVETTFIPTIRPSRLDPTASERTLVPCP